MWAHADQAEYVNASLGQTMETAEVGAWQTIIGLHWWAGRNTPKPLTLSATQGPQAPSSQANYTTDVAKARRSGHPDWRRLALHV